MAEETQEKPASPNARPEGAKEGARENATGAAKPPRPAIGLQPLILGGAIVVALAAGTVAGLLLLGPRLAAMRNAAPPAAHAEGATDDEGGPAKGKDKGGHGKEDEKAIVYRLDNLIVNPAGSQGTRFLMASVAVEVPDARIESRLRDRDFQVRDAVIATLERQSLEILASPGGRDSVKARLAETLQPMVGRGVPLHIYLPQFVIQ